MSFGADRTVKVNLKASVSDYIGKMTAASKATRDFSVDAVKHAEKHRQSWDKVGKGMALTGAAIGLAVIGAVKAFADFDAQMSQVRAVSNASAGDMDKLTAAARAAGKGTKFSATEAAQATTELAKVGISTADILGGALTGSLNLAAAGNVDLARSAEISGQAMKIFNLQGKDVGQIADALANGANKSAADVEQLAQALQQGGLVASQFGLNLDETVGGLSLFADNALQGSDAGTALKTMLLRLNPQTKEAAAAMESIGLKAYDASGNFVGLETVAGQLQRGLSGLTQEQRDSALMTIFGQDAIRGANVLYQEGAAGVAEYTKAIGESGAAARVAAINQDNLRGDVEKLTGALSDLAIGAGSAGDGIARGLIQNLTGLIDSVSSLPEPLQSAALGLAAITAAALLTGGALITLVPKIAATKVALAEMGITSTKASAALKGLAAAAAVVGVAVLADELAKYAPQARVASVDSDKLAASLTRVAEGSKAAGAFGEVFKGHSLFSGEVTDTADAMDRFALSAQVAFGQNMGDKIDRLTSFGQSTRKFGEQVSQIDAAMAKMVQAGNIDGAARLYDQLMASIDAANKAGANIPVDEVAAKFKEYQGAIDAANAAQKSQAAGATGVTESLNEVKQSATDVKEALDQYIQGLQDAGLVVLSARAANRELKGALAEVSGQIEKNGKTLNENTVKGRENADFLDGLAKKHLDAADAIYKETGSEEKYRASLVQSRASLVQTAIRFGMTRKQAETYADSIIKIPAAKTTTATFKTVGLSELTAAGEYFKNLRDKHITLTVGTVKIGGTKVNAGQFAEGGSVNGYVAGPGTATSDSIPAYLSNGEYVVRAAAVEKYGKTFFDSVNAMRFASGGMVAASRGGTQPAAAPVTFNAYGSDADKAMTKALREWEYRTVPR